MLGLVAARVCEVLLLLPQHQPEDDAAEDNYVEHNDGKDVPAPSGVCSATQLILASRQCLLAAQAALPSQRENGGAHCPYHTTSAHMCCRSVSGSDWVC